MKTVITFVVLFIIGFFIFSGAINGFIQGKAPLIGSGKNSSATPAPQIAGETAGQSGVSQTNPQLNQQSPALPKTFLIPKLGINVPVEHVGMDSKGAMDVPKDADNVAWYKLGYKVGDNGSAVIAGHFDKEDGSPAVFYNLTSLASGDEIIVRDDAGKEYKYKVTKKQTFNFDEVPLNEVFASTDKARLNLITCDGVFDKNAKNYSKRTVIYSELL
jgi:LPXTG-site transpeptidase (sortase) family protein